MRPFWIAILFSVLMALTACQPPTPTIPPEPTPAGTPIPTLGAAAVTPLTPTQDFSQFANVWKQYNSPEHGITFEYPAVYDEPAYMAHGCNISVSTNADITYIDIGQRILVTLFPPSNQTLPEFVAQTIQDKAAQNISVTSQTGTSVAGIEATMLEYRVDGTNRFGTVTYFDGGERIYGIGYEAGMFCELAAQDTTSGMSEAGTYLHILQTFQFTR